tara:strand:+ start:289 stop:726 length:438 start_codon:yes stop_codon:yes gene_type:complete
MNTKKSVFSKLFSKKPLTTTQLKKQKVALGLVDEINYEFQYLEEETSRMSYVVEEWFEGKFDEWYQLRSDLQSIYFQNSEAYISPADVAGDKEKLEEIKVKADELGIDVNDVYDTWQEHMDALDYLDYIDNKFEEQKQELKDFGF